MRAFEGFSIKCLTLLYFLYLQRALSFEIVELDVKIVRETKQRYYIIMCVCKSVFALFLLTWIDKN